MVTLRAENLIGDERLRWVQSRKALLREVLMSPSASLESKKLARERFSLLTSTTQPTTSTV